MNNKIEVSKTTFGWFFYAYAFLVLVSLIKASIILVTVDLSSSESL